MWGVTNMKMDTIGKTYQVSRKLYNDPRKYRSCIHRISAPKSRVSRTSHRQDWRRHIRLYKGQQRENSSPFTIAFLAQTTDSCEQCERSSKWKMGLSRSPIPGCRLHIIRSDTIFRYIKSGFHGSLTWMMLGHVK